ncbi:MAG: hypothetical protein OXN89_16445 [Bryobacterales bacterium]|nr:hypothetical protein [Bryobacterales bacterium]
MMEPPWSSYDRVRWDQVNWLFDHPEHIDRQPPSREEEIALKRVLVGDRLALPSGNRPTRPPPLDHFSKARHHRRPRSRPDPEHKWLRFAIGRWFAGFRDAPSPAQLREYLLMPSLAAFPNAHPRSTLHNLFSYMAPVEMLELRTAEGLTIHELVRALHHSGVWRSCLVRRLEPYASPRLRPRYLDAMKGDEHMSDGT